MAAHCGRCGKDITCQAEWYRHINRNVDAGRRQNHAALSKSALPSTCTLFNAILVPPGAVADGAVGDQEGGDDAAMLDTSDGEDGPPVAVVAPEDAFTPEAIELLLDKEYGAEFPYRSATPCATDVDENNGLLTPLSDVEKAVARAMKHLPDSARDDLLSALNKGCVLSLATLTVQHRGNACMTKKMIEKIVWMKLISYFQSNYFLART
jgi:hypothetical protein